MESHLAALFGHLPVPEGLSTGACRQPEVTSRTPSLGPTACQAVPAEHAVDSLQLIECLAWPSSDSSTLTSQQPPQVPPPARRQSLQLIHPQGGIMSTGNSLMGESSGQLWLSHPTPRESSLPPLHSATPPTLTTLFSEGQDPRQPVLISQQQHQSSWAAALAAEDSLFHSSATDPRSMETVGGERDSRHSLFHNSAAGLHSTEAVEGGSSSLHPLPLPAGWDGGVGGERVQVQRSSVSMGASTGTQSVYSVPGIGQASTRTPPGTSASAGGNDGLRVKDALGDRAVTAGGGGEVGGPGRGGGGGAMAGEVANALHHTHTNLYSDISSLQVWCGAPQGVGHSVECGGRALAQATTFFSTSFTPHATRPMPLNDMTIILLALCPCQSNTHFPTPPQHTQTTPSRTHTPLPPPCRRLQVGWAVCCRPTWRTRSQWPCLMLKGWWWCPQVRGRGGHK